MIYVGLIEKEDGYYNFKVRHFIDERGKINEASPCQVKNDMEDYQDCSSIEDCFAARITIWVLNSEGNERLDQLADGRKLIWNLDPNNITLRGDRKAFTTVTNYTAEENFREISSVFPVKKENFESVTDELLGKLNIARGKIEEWIEEKQRQYGVNNLADLEGEYKKAIVTDVNNLFPDYNNSEYGRIYGDIYKTAAYLYKYGFAYTYLYKSMYRDLFALMHEDEEIKVLSIGCGAKIDLAGLKLALLDTSRNWAAYHGIDLNDWTNNDSTNFCLFPDQGCFEEGNIIEILNRENVSYNDIEENIIVFPYSMSELVDADEPWSAVLNNLPGRLISDRVYIASNIRLRDNERIDDNAFSQLIGAMNNAGYELQEPVTSVRNINNPMYYISDIDDGGKLADALKIGTTRDADTTVAGYLQSIKNIDESITCNAITSTKYISYNIAKFIRNNENDYQR